MRRTSPSYCRAGWRLLPPSSCNLIEKSWLLQPGALTPRLRQLGEVQLQVLAEYPTTLQAEEADALNFKHGMSIWVREVLMSIEGIACLVARSVTSLTASHVAWRAIRHLHTRPLGDILYQDHHVRRSYFRYQTLKQGHPFYTLTQTALDKQDKQRVLARCSIFWRYRQPLLLTEGFLPAFWEKAH